jgi:hypothetical protein
MSWLDTARRNGITEGLLGGNRRWVVLGSIAWGVRAIGWANRRDQRVLFRDQLQPGEQLLISERQLNPKGKRKGKGQSAPGGRGQSSPEGRGGKK